jgi:hypothetical protein
MDLIGAWSSAIMPVVVQDGIVSVGMCKVAALVSACMRRVAVVAGSVHIRWNIYSGTPLQTDACPWSAYSMRNLASDWSQDNSRFLARQQDVDPCAGQAMMLWMRRLHTNAPNNGCRNHYSTSKDPDMPRLQQHEITSKASVSPS